MKILRKLARKTEIIWDIDTLKVCVFISHVLRDLKVLQGIHLGQSAV
jgi:hypothetical protein